MISPLRYPGGKAKLFGYFASLIAKNNLYGLTYAEPYAGGAGLALKLLAHGYVRQIRLNDIDLAINAFWRSVLDHTDELCRLVWETELSVDEWRRQRVAYARGLRDGVIPLGFAAYYLNRTSRSGIIEGSGPIGGYAQSGVWKIDARFNRNAQIAQIYEIARHASAIKLSAEDALDFVSRQFDDLDVWTYLDPPYYVKGSKLYKNFYNHDDHVRIGDLLKRNSDRAWVLSYDYVPEILKIYNGLTPTIYNLLYTAGAVGQGREVVFSGGQIELPQFDGFKVAA